MYKYMKHVNHTFTKQAESFNKQTLYNFSSLSKNKCFNKSLNFNKNYTNNTNSTNGWLTYSLTYIPMSKFSTNIAKQSEEVNNLTNK